MSRSRELAKASLNYMLRPVNYMLRPVLPLLPVLVQNGFSRDIANKIITDRRNAPNRQPIVDTLRFASEPEHVPAPVYNSISAWRVLLFIRRRASLINATAELFADARSRHLLASILAYRANGPAISPLPNASAFADKLSAVKTSKVAPAPLKFPPFDFALHCVKFEGVEIEVECWDANILNTFIETQYYFSRSGIRIGPERGDTVIDAGACFGDTALAFSATVGPLGSVHAFEPLPRQHAVLTRNLKNNPELAKRVHVHQLAVDSVSDRVLLFSDGGPAARKAKNGEVLVTTTSIDDFVGRAGLKQVDFMKMDIEGAEVEALKGARNTIKQFRPRLAISIYHSFNDLFEIPRLVHEIDPSYQLYIDHHTIHAEETVLYARPAVQAET